MPTQLEMLKERAIQAEERLGPDSPWVTALQLQIRNLESRHDAPRPNPITMGKR